MGSIRISRNAGVMLTGIWLILYGVFTLFNILEEAKGTILGILALIAGVLVFIEYKD